MQGKNKLRIKIESILCNSNVIVGEVLRLHIFISNFKRMELGFTTRHFSKALPLLFLCSKKLNKLRQNTKLNLFRTAESGALKRVG